MNNRLFMFSLLASLVACGGNDSTPAATDAEPASPAAAPAAEAPAAEAPAAEAAPEAPAASNALKPDAEGIVRLEGTDLMKFNTDRIEVEGLKVKIELKHTGTFAKEVMGHNVVILKAGTDATAWAAKAVSAKATEYIPEGGDEVIAHTKLLGGGESDTIEFEVPAPGEYPFICSFPGHAVMMKGVLVVK